MDLPANTQSVYPFCALNLEFTHVLPLCRTATAILSAVQSTISARKATKVTVVGHSLGAALALLDGVYLPLHISGVSFRVVGYGMPRVSCHVNSLCCTPLLIFVCVSRLETRTSRTISILTFPVQSPISITSQYISTQHYCMILIGQFREDLVPTVPG